MNLGILPRTLHPALLAGLVVACGSVPIDDQRTDSRLFPANGVIRGSVTYQGPRPCSKSGHIVGNAIVLVFDRRNPPPPAGLANTAVNFGVVTGDVLFANEPRAAGDTLYCPKDSGFTDTISASAPFAIAPIDAGSYVVQAFFDYAGSFLPTFKFRNLPVAGDVGGGYIDVADALKDQNRNDANYLPIFLPVDVGTPQPLPAGSPPGTIPTFTMPRDGFVADNIPVTIGLVLPFTRPYFYAASLDDSDQSGKVGTTPPAGSGQTDPNYFPVVTLTQDMHIEAPPAALFPVFVNKYQASFPAIRLDWGVPAGELAAATDPAQPFLFQVAPFPQAGLLVWSSGKPIPERKDVPALWPLVVFAKLADESPTDPTAHVQDPQGIQAQGGPGQPIVIMQGLTVYKDSLVNTVLFAPPTQPNPSQSLTDHVTVLIRPAVVCFDAAHIDRGGTLVTPYLTGTSPDPSEPGPKPLFDVAAFLAAEGKLIRGQPVIGCLPKGRYGINAVYPTGQAWTTPNEAGTCAGTEGTTNFNGNTGTCDKKPRQILYSQGNRAVIEVVAASDPNFCTMNPVPAACLPSPPQ
jgi:hypothetical protein